MFVCDILHFKPAQRVIVCALPYMTVFLFNLQTKPAFICPKKIPGGGVYGQMMQHVDRCFPSECLHFEKHMLLSASGPS